MASWYSLIFFKKNALEVIRIVWNMQKYYIFKSLLLNPRVRNISVG